MEPGCFWWVRAFLLGMGFWQYPLSLDGDHAMLWQITQAPSVSPKAVIRAASCVFHVPDFSEVILVTLSHPRAAKPSYLPTLNLLMLGGSGEGFCPTPFHFPCHIPFFYSFLSVGST